MKKIFILFGLSLFVSCGQTKSQSTKVKDFSKVDVTKYLNSITAPELSKHLYIVAADSMQGRDTGSEGQKKAGTYLISEYKK